MLFPPNKIQVPNVRPFRPLLSIRAFLTKTQKSRGNRTFQPVSAGLSGVPLRAIRAQKRTRQTCPALRDSIHERWRKRRKSAGRSPRSRSVPGYSVLVESHLINCRHQALLPVCSDQTEGFADIISHFAQKCKGEFFPRRAAAGKTGKISAEARSRPVNDKKRRRLRQPPMKKYCYSTRHSHFGYAVLLSVSLLSGS